MEPTEGEAGLSAGLNAAAAFNNFADTIEAIVQKALENPFGTKPDNLNVATWNMEQQDIPISPLQQMRTDVDNATKAVASFQGDILQLKATGQHLQSSILSANARIDYLVARVEAAINDEPQRQGYGPSIQPPS